MPFDIDIDIDITGKFIVVSAICTAIYIAIELIYHKDIYPINSIVVFVTTFALLTGFNLIVVAIKGDPENLPTYWREYLGVAGIVGIVLSLQHLIFVFKKIRSPKIGQGSPANKQT